MLEAVAPEEEEEEVLPPPRGTPFAVCSRSLLEDVIFASSAGTSNALILHETYVIRVFRKLCQEYRVSWNSILDTTRHGCAFLDPELHDLLAEMWEQRVRRGVSLEEHNCYERVMGRDYVRQSDLLKLAGTLIRVCPEPKRVWTFFGVDGYLGDDPKRYVDHMKYDKDDWRGKHVQAVRLLYHRSVDSPDMMRDTLEAIFKPNPDTNNRVSDEVRDTYTRIVGGCDVVRQIGEWRAEQHKDKKKRSEEATHRGLKKRAREGDQNSDDETTTAVNEERKRGGGSSSYTQQVADEEEDPSQPTTPPASPPPSTTLAATVVHKLVERKRKSSGNSNRTPPAKAARGTHESQ